MKSSKGKDPANGIPKTPKKVPASSKSTKERQKDPVEVRKKVLFGTLLSYLSKLFI